MALVSNNSTLELLTSFKSLPSMISRVCCQIFELRYHIDFDNSCAAGTFVNGMQFSMSWFALDRVLFSHVRSTPPLLQTCLFFGIFAFNQE